MKKLFSISIMLLLVFDVACSKKNKEENTVVELATDFEYRIENSVVTIVNYIGNKDDVVIPKEIKGYPVVKIADKAFYDKFHEAKLNSVIIPNSVKTIGDYAFSGNELTNVVIPNSVKTISDSIFNYNKLTNVVIPDSVKYIMIIYSIFICIWFIYLFCPFIYSFIHKTLL
jgi:hypothetical protein